jgi:hypothetical protein
MRLQDKIRGHRIAKLPGEGGRFGHQGVKADDDLPLPHHSGFVAVEDVKPLFHHQKIKA